MKLIGTHLSPFLMRALICGRLKGVEIALEAPGDTHDAAFRRLNPLGKVPVLVDGDFVLPESIAICDYLDETLPGPALWPGTARERALARLICQIVDLYLSPDMFNAFLPALAPGPIEGAAARVAVWLDGVEAYLRPAEAWLTGDAPGIADAVMATTLFYFDTLGARYGAASWLAARPLLDAWWLRTKADPVFAQAFAEQLAVLSPELYEGRAPAPAQA